MASRKIEMDQAGIGRPTIVVHFCGSGCNQLGKRMGHHKWMGRWIMVERKGEVDY